MHFLLLYYYFHRGTIEGIRLKVFEVDDFVSEERREKRPKFLRAGKHIEVNLINGSNIRGALHELRGFQEALEKEIASDTDDTGKVSS